MSSASGRPLSTIAVLTLADIKAAADAFDRGDAGVFDALDVIIAAVDMYRAASGREPHRGAA